MFESQSHMLSRYGRLALLVPFVAALLVVSGCCAPRGSARINVNTMPPGKVVYIIPAEEFDAEVARTDGAVYDRYYVGVSPVDVSRRPGDYVIAARDPEDDTWVHERHEVRRTTQRTRYQLTFP